MILVIRISGLVEMQKRVQETLFRLRMRRKYSAVLLKPTIESIKVLRRVRDHVAYGDIDKDTLKLLIQKRAIQKNKARKIDAEKIAEQIEKRDPESWEIKPFFRLHPPRGGIDSKNHFGTSKMAVLGDNKEKINLLVRRML